MNIRVTALTLMTFALAVMLLVSSLAFTGDSNPANSITPTPVFVADAVTRCEEITTGNFNLGNKVSNDAGSAEVLRSVCRACASAFNPIDSVVSVGTSSTIGSQVCYQQAEFTGRCIDRGSNIETCIEFEYTKVDIYRDCLVQNGKDSAYLQKEAAFVLGSYFGIPPASSDSQCGKIVNTDFVNDCSKATNITDINNCADDVRAANNIAKDELTDAIKNDEEAAQRENAASQTKVNQAKASATSCGSFSTQSVRNACSSCLLEYDTNPATNQSLNVCAPRAQSFADCLSLLADEAKCKLAEEASWDFYAACRNNGAGLSESLCQNYDNQLFKKISACYSVPGTTAADCQRFATDTTAFLNTCKAEGINLNECIRATLRVGDCMLSKKALSTCSSTEINKSKAALGITKVVGTNDPTETPTNPPPPGGTGGVGGSGTPPAATMSCPAGSKASAIDPTLCPGGSDRNNCVVCLCAAQTWSGIGCVNTTSTNGIVVTIVRITLGVIGGVMLLLMISAGYLYQTGQIDNIAKAKQRIQAMFTALIFLVFSTLLLRIIGVNILDVTTAGILG